MDILGTNKSMIVEEGMNNIEKIKLLILDYQGVLVPEGSSPERYSKETLLKLLNVCNEKEITLAVITSFGKLPDDFPEEIMVYTSSVNKVNSAEKIMNELHIDYNQVMFVADGILDLPLLQRVKISACPADARREVKRIADIKFNSSAGKELLLELISFLKGEYERVN